MGYTEIRTINDITLEDTKARASIQNLQAEDTKINASIQNLQEEKANKSEISNGLHFKGTTTYNALPTSGNNVGDFYYATDGNSTHGEGNYTWNGTAWCFSGKTTNISSAFIDKTLSVSGKAADAKATGDAIQGVRDDLASEITRAETAEKANADNIATEVERAQAAESALSTKITEETERAKAAEQANADGIAAEASRAKGEEQRLDAAITAETTRAEQAEQALDTRTAALESCGFVVQNGKVCIKYRKS